jgi:hypothetical protein
MEKVLVIFLTSLVFFLGVLILRPDSQLAGNSQAEKEQKIAIIGTFAQHLQSDPRIQHWTASKALAYSSSDAPSPAGLLSEELRLSRSKNDFFRPHELPVSETEKALSEALRQEGMEKLHRIRATGNREELLSAIEMMFQIERNPEPLRQTETLALEAIRTILQELESPLRSKAMKLLEIDLLPNASSPDRKAEIEALLNEARLATPQEN